MNQVFTDLITGRKIFFIVPDLVLFPENFLEEYLAEGYECYFIGNDIACPLSRKIDILVSVFKDSILYFNIDSTVSNINWPLYLKQFQYKYAEKIPAGIMHEKCQADEQRIQLDSYYRDELHFPCNRIELEYQKRSNFGIIGKAIVESHALGRRKSIRVICEDNASLSFMLDNNRFSTSLHDISINHFSCIINEGSLPLKVNSIVPDIQINLKGLRLRTNAKILFIRETDTERLFVFAFLKNDGNPGLETFTKQLLVPKLYELISHNCHQLLNTLFYHKQS